MQSRAEVEVETTTTRSPAATIASSSAPSTTILPAVQA